MRSSTTSPRRTVRARRRRSCSRSASPQAAGGSAVAVFAAPEGEQLTSFRSGVESALSQVAAVEHVASVSDPFATDRVSDDGRVGYAEITLDVPSTELGRPAAAAMADGPRPGSRRRADGRARRRGGVPQRPEVLGQRGDRGARRARHPRRRLRDSRGRSRADRSRTGRRRRRDQRHRAAGWCAGRLHRRTDLRRVDRAGCRHRLLPVHRLPLPREPRRGPGQRARRCPRPWARRAPPSSSPAGPSSCRWPPSR